MTRADAIVLAERKAKVWNFCYRVLRCTSEKHLYKVEQSGSYDSPPGWVLVEIITPTIEGNEKP